MNTPIRIILEGVNYCGKDAILTAFLALCKNAIVIQTRGYWRPALRDQLGLSAPDLLLYFRTRADACLPLIRATRYEEIFIARLHLTDIVYCQLYLNARQDYGALEAELNQEGVGLVLLDINDATMEARRSASPRGTSGHADRSLSALINKRDLFRDAFEQSRISRRLRVDNSNGGPTAEERAKEILSWWTVLTP